MRTTQFIGLSKEAIDFIDQMAIKEVKLPDDWEDKAKQSYNWYHLSYINGYKQALIDYLPKSFITNPIGVVTGMFNEEVHTLLEYRLKDGTSVHEVIQSEIWSSGPVIFLELRTDSGITIASWSDSDMEAYL